RTAHCALHRDAIRTQGAPPLSARARRVWNTPIPRRLADAITGGYGPGENEVKNLTPSTRERRATFQMTRPPQLPDGMLRLLCSEIEADCTEDSVRAPGPAERTAN